MPSIKNIGHSLFQILRFIWKNKNFETNQIKIYLQK